MALTITIPGAVEATIGATAPAVLTVGVGTPGATGPAGPAGQGVPVGGTAGQFLTKIDGTNYNTDWTTVNLSAYAVKANNLSDLASASTARTNLGLGSLAVVNDAPSDGSQYARKNGAWDVVSAGTDYITSVSSPLTVTTGNLTIDLSAYAPLASPALTGNPTAPTPTFGDDDTSIATTAFVQAGLLGGTANARNLEVEVRNQSGSSIAAGSIVYISGATGNKPLITLSQANNDANSAQTMGFVKTTIANNGTGYVIVRGILDNIDTSALTEGVQLYLSPTTAGTWTTTKPYAPQHLVYVGVVIRSHPTIGTILVAVQNGYELDELHNVAAQTPADLDLLSFESSTSLWKNKTFSALGLLTSADAGTTYAPIASPTFTGTVTIPAGASISGFAPLASPALTGNVTITSNSAGAALFIEQAGAGNILTLHDQATDTTFVAIDANGKVSTIASDATNGAGFNIAHGVAPTTPVNGDIWTTTGGLFARINGGTTQLMNLGSTQTVSGSITFSNASQTLGNSTAASTINVGTGATLTATTKAINIGTAGVAGSTTNIIVGPVLGASTTSIGGTTAASTLNLATGATLTATTKAVNIGTSGVAGSTTNIAIGSTTGTSTTTLQGTTNGITAAADTNSVALATTAFVVGQASSTAPVVDGTATVGTSLKYARADHVHPTDTTRAPLASPTFTGTPLSTTAAVDTNTTQIATTAYVVGQGYLKSATAASTYAPLASPTFTGTVTIPAGASISGFAPLASPTFTGTPTLPTGTIATTQTAGNNTTAVATTAFVTAAVPAFATETQAIVGTSSTTTISPLTMRNILSNAGYTAHTSLVGNYSSYVSGSGSVTTLWSNFVGLSVTAANGKVAFLPNSQVAYFPFTSRGKAELNLDWTKPIWFSFRFNYSSAAGIGDSNTVNRVTIGKQSSVFGDLASKGFGVTWTAGTAGAFTVSAHNGTTLTSSASAVTVSNTTYFPTTSSAADFLVYSDGAGNITLFCNGVQVATTTGGPSSGNLVGGRFTFEADNTTSTSGNVVCDYTGIRSMYSY